MKKILTVIFLSIIFVFPAQALALTKDGQPVIAYYFNYWGAPWGKTVDRGWDRWSGNPDAVIGPETWRRNIATGDKITYPLIGPYDSSNPEVVRWQIKNAKSAGIDAFAIMLWTYEFDKNDIAGAKSADYPAWGEQEWKVMKDVTIPTIAREGFHFILGDEMVEAVEINCDYKNGPCPLTFDNSDPKNEQVQHARCSNPATPCMSLDRMPENVRGKLQAGNNYLTHKRYVDLVLNAYAGLTLAAPPYPYWNAYLRTGNRTNGLPNLPGMPYYYIPFLEHYRENPSIRFSDSDMGHKLKRSLEVVEELIGGPVAWFGYDGNVTWGNTSGCAPASSCADFWSPGQFGKIYALVDGFGITRSFLYADAPGQPGSGESASQYSINYTSNVLNSKGIGFVPNIQTSFDDTILNRGRSNDDPVNAQTHPWIKRNNGDTFRRSIRVYKNIPVKPDFYWLSSWNATYLEGYTVEPAVTWGDDTSSDPYHYLKILASDLTGATFQPAPLPPPQSVDPLMWKTLGLSKVYIADFNLLMGNFTNIFDFNSLVANYGK